MSDMISYHKSTLSIVDSTKMEILGCVFESRVSLQCCHENSSCQMVPFYIFPIHPNTSLEGVLGIFLALKCLLRRCLDV